MFWQLLLYLICFYAWIEFPVGLFDPPHGHPREKIFRRPNLRWSDKERDYMASGETVSELLPPGA